MRQGCRVTPGGGNPRESATEKRPPGPARARVKRWGKSPPRNWQQKRHGKPHPEQCRIGAWRGSGRRDASRAETAAGTSQPAGPGWQLDRPGNGCGRGMVIQKGNLRTESGLQAIRAPLNGMVARQGAISDRAPFPTGHPALGRHTGLAAHGPPCGAARPGGRPPGPPRGGGFGRVAGAGGNPPGALPPDPRDIWKRKKGGAWRFSGDVRRSGGVVVWW